MSAHIPTFQVLTVVLAFVGAGIALAGAIGLVTISVRFGEVPQSTLRRAFGLWAAGAVLLAAGTPAAFRATLAGSPTLRALALAAVGLGVVAVAVAPAYLWQATLMDE